MFTLENGTGRVSHYWVSTLSSERSHVKAVCRGGCCLQKDFDEQDVPPGTLESPQRRCIFIVSDEKFYVQQILL